MPPTRRSTRESAVDRVARRLRNVLSSPLRAFQVSVGALVSSRRWAPPATCDQDLDVLDALYMTVITLATVGFREVEPLNPAGKIFTIDLIVMGVTTVAAAVRAAAEMTLGQTFWISVQRRRMKELVMDLEEHFIVCGYGRLGARRSYAIWRPAVSGSSSWM